MADFDGKEDLVLPVSTRTPQPFRQSSCLDKLETIFRDKTKLFWWLLLVRLSVLSWFIYVNSRQIFLLYSHAQAPNCTEAFVSEQEFEQARLRNILLGFSSILGLTINIVLTFLLTFFSVMPWIWIKMSSWLECCHQSGKLLGQHLFVRKLEDEQEDYKQSEGDYYAGEVEKSMAFVLVLAPFLITPIALRLPLDSVSLVVSVVLFAGIATAMTGLVVLILKNGGIAMKWLYIWLLFSILPLLLSDVLLPLLETRSIIDGNSTNPLFEQMSQLAAAVDFPVTSVYVTPSHQHSEDGSDENAYYGGILFNQRIVLTKSIFCNITNDEVIAVLGHKLGHWKLGHALHEFVFLEANILILILLFQRLYRKPALYKAFGFYEEQPALIFGFIFFWFIMLPYQVLVSMASNWLSQFGEYKADAFAAAFGLGEHLCSALLKIGTNETLPMDNDWLYSLSKSSHPSTWSRCAALKTN